MMKTIVLLVLYTSITTVNYIMMLLY